MNQLEKLKTKKNIINNKCYKDGRFCIHRYLSKVYDNLMCTNSGSCINGSLLNLSGDVKAANKRKIMR